MELAVPHEARARRDKRALALTVLDDIERAARALPHCALEPTQVLLQALHDRLHVASERLAGRAVGPELFRWLGAVSWADAQGDTARLAIQARALPNLLIGRVIACRPTAPLRLSVWASPAQMLRIPQAALTVGPVSHTLRLDRDRLDWGACDLSVDQIRARIDGATAKGPHLPGAPVHFHQRGDELLVMVRELNVVASRPVGHDEVLTVIPIERLDSHPRELRIVSTMGAGAALLRDHAPSLHAEVMTVLDGITLVTGRRFVGGSDIGYHGVAVLNPDEDWSATTYADHLVHEGAHIALHAANELEPLLHNADEYGAPSPIREDPRPLYGILHSTFVFCRLVQFFAEAARSIDSDEAWFRLHRHLKGFYDGMATLAEYADFSHAGARLFREMSALRDHWLDVLPLPDPRFYLRVGKDYVV